MTQQNGTRPNIVFILTDDQGPWAMGCAGNTELVTPNLDRLATEGTRFDNHFCCSPVCSPARATILTGRIPSNHGVHDWISGGNCRVHDDMEPVEYLAGLPATTDRLAEHGYRCGISGKWHLGDSIKPQKHFEFWRVHARGGGPYYGADMIRDGEVYTESCYVTDAITDHALEFLDEYGAGLAPFYLSVHYTAPHSPWGRDHHPHDVYDALRNDCPFESVPDVPPHPWNYKPGLFPADADTRRDTLSGYFTAITMMDRNVGRILDRLDAMGIRKNTLIVFTSDNGMNMGHHGIYGKGNGTFPLNMYDTAVKVPMIASQPGTVPANHVCRELTSHYDLMPTLCEVGAAGPADPDLPGRSFAPLLCGAPQDGHSHVVAFHEYGPVRMIRTAEWKYVHRTPYGPHELYNLNDDPDETRNLANEPAHGTHCHELNRELALWFERYVDPERDGYILPVTGRGQSGMVHPGCGPETFAGSEAVRATFTRNQDA